MKKRTAVLALAVISVRFSPPARSRLPDKALLPPGPGTSRPWCPRSSARFPAENAAGRDALCAEILKLGPAAVARNLRPRPPSRGR